MNTASAHRADEDTQPTLLLTLGEVAVHLRGTRRSIEREIARRHLHVVRIGRSVRVDRLVLNRYVTLMREVDEGEVPPEPRRHRL